MDVVKAAMLEGINAYCVHDAGRTQVPRGSMTAIAVGPGKPSKATCSSRNSSSSNSSGSSSNSSTSNSTSSSRRDSPCGACLCCSASKSG
ncbi:hypothetical protein Emed_002578 [Eimeria media]